MLACKEMESWRVSRRKTYRLVLKIVNRASLLLQHALCSETEAGAGKREFVLHPKISNRALLHFLPNFSVLRLLEIGLKTCRINVFLLFSLINFFSFFKILVK